MNRPKDFKDCDPSSPCPHVSCRYHLAIDVKGRSIRVQKRPIENLPHTCAIQAANDGPRGTKEIARILGLSRAMVSLEMRRALDKLEAEF